MAIDEFKADSAVFVLNQDPVGQAKLQVTNIESD